MARTDGTGHNNEAPPTDNEESTLDLALRCGECGEPLVLDLETPIGLGGVDLLTPAALCSQACADANVKRVTEAFDRCSCGAVVTLTETVRSSLRLGVVGCSACDYSGRRQTAGAVRHYWAAAGALCVPPGESSLTVHVTVQRDLVTCPACLHALIVEDARAKRAPVSS